MGRTDEVRWGRWVAGAAGALVLLRSAAYVMVRLIRFTGHEVQARGGDVAFVLGLAERHRGGRTQGVAP
jgi:hypothetical protein